MLSRANKVEETLFCLMLCVFRGVRCGWPDWYLHFVEDLIKAVCFKWQISTGSVDVLTVFGK